MFKIKGFYVLLTGLLSMLCQPAWSREDTWNELQDSRYRIADIQHKPLKTGPGSINGDLHGSVVLAQNNAVKADTNTVKSDSCYGKGKEVLDARIPCCQGLEVLTEVGTNKKFCDIKPGASSAWWVWGMVLIFPIFLLVFIIFGIRNKLAAKKSEALFNDTNGHE